MQTYLGSDRGKELLSHPYRAKNTELGSKAQIEPFQSSAFLRETAAR